MFVLRAGLALTVCFALAACGKPKTEPAPAAAPAEVPAAAAPVVQSDPAIVEADMRRHIATLASDAYEGRAPMTPGGEKTRNYIAGELARLGFKPVGGSYMQGVPLVEATVDPEKSFFRFDKGKTAIDLAWRKDVVFWSKRVVDIATVNKTGAVFVGYGVVAPEAGWNDYAGVDVKGKTVVILVNDPGYKTGDDQLFGGKAMTYYGRWTYKYEEAARQGAAAALLVHDDDAAAYGWGVVEGSWTGPQIDLARPGDGADRAAIEGWISNGAARRIFAAAGLDFAKLETAANKRGFKPVALKGLIASGAVTQSVRRNEDANVLGVLPGTERPSEYVLYTAHWDHLGVDPDAPGDDKIFNGAVDNATGVAAILEIAEKFATKPPKRSIMIAAVTAEESGLLGSAWLADHFPTPLGKVVAGINIDAMLPTPRTKDMTVIGYGLSELDDVLADVARRHGMDLHPDSEPEKGYFYRSDHISFAKKGVPVLYADGGTDLVEGGVAAGEAVSEGYRKDRYHKPADEYSDEWDMSGMTEATNILYETGRAIADGGAWPNWRAGAEFRAARDASRAEAARTK